MRVSKPPVENSSHRPPDEPDDPRIHPLLALSLAVGLAAVTGLVAGWPAAVTVLLAVLSLFARTRGGGG